MMQGRIQLFSAVAIVGLLAFGGAYAQPSLPSLPPPASTNAALPPVGLPSLPASSQPVVPSLPQFSGAGTALPPVGLPLMPQPAGEATGDTPPVASQEQADELESATPKEFSFGKSNLSILFLPTQTERMKNAIRTYETSNKEAKQPTFVAPEPTVKGPVEKIDEPTTYPVFYLASIAYEAPGDWSIWISGHKITSRKNETDISILGVSRESVTFLWKPEYSEAIMRRKEDGVFAETVPVKHKLAAVQPVTLDEEGGAVTFTLRPNQSFSVGYFSVFEGYVDSPKLQPVISNSGGSMDMMSSGVPTAGMGQAPFPPPSGQPGRTSTVPTPRPSGMQNTPFPPNAPSQRN
jgi:hypothetical protein